jgi:hypothetical protein
MRNKPLVIDGNLFAFVRHSSTSYLLQLGLADFRRALWIGRRSLKEVSLQCFIKGTERAYVVIIRRRHEINAFPIKDRSNLLIYALNLISQLIDKSDSFTHLGDDSYPPDA